MATNTFYTANADRDVDERRRVYAASYSDSILAHCCAVALANGRHCHWLCHTWRDSNASHGALIYGNDAAANRQTAKANHECRWPRGRAAGQDLEFYATQYELLEARPLAERVASELGLYQSERFLEAHGLDPDLLDFQNEDRGRTQLEQEHRRMVVNELLDTVEIAPIRMSKLVDINYTSRDPALSAQIANQWASGFIALSMERQFASTADARDFLEQRLATLKERLEESERELVLYGSDTGIVTLDQIRDPNGRAIANRTLTGATLEQLARELNTATAQRIAAEARLGLTGKIPQRLSAAILLPTYGTSGQRPLQNMLVFPCNLQPNFLL